MNTSGSMGKQEAQSPKAAKKENPDFHDLFTPDFWENQEAEIKGMKA